ncbi:MAG: alpha/beta hydrolase [Enhydrobacter sp.]
MARPTLVLLPGLLNTARVFEPLISELGDAAHVVVPELYHCESIEDMAQAALGLAPERFSLGGFSMGGYVAFEILRRAPERVERLALIDTQASPDSPESTARRRAFVDQSKIGRFHGVTSTLMPSLIHPSRLSDLSVPQPIVEMAQVIAADGFAREQRAIMARADSRPLLVDIKVPTLVISGRQDRTVPLARAEEMAADISHSQLVVLEDCGHMAPLEKPVELAAALRRWLSQ